MYENFVPINWREKFNWNTIDNKTRALLGEFGYYMFSLHEQSVSEIEEIKYGGKLVILENGTRFEVDSTDSETVEFWDVGDKVLIIDDEMYNIEESEKVDVKREI